MKPGIGLRKRPITSFIPIRFLIGGPEAKCIHVIRDPRDNYVSYKKKQPGWSVKTFANNWIRSTKAGLKNQKNYGEGRYHILRFEDLLLNPETETRSLAAFLGLEWHEALLQPTRVGSEWGGNSMFAETFTSISKDPIGRWKTNTSMRDLVILQSIARKTMGAVGYDLEKVLYEILQHRGPHQDNKRTTHCLVETPNSILNPKRY